MISSNEKKFHKKVLKGIPIAIIVYITLSMVSTKIIYDSVFKRYNVEDDSVQAEQMVYQKIVFSYPCDGRTLVGSLYTGNGENGLIVLAPGFRAETIEYEGVICGFLQEGFDVFAFDPTGCGPSEGENYVGFPQMITDLDATLEFIAQSNNFGHKDIFLFGHSRGAYGVCCSMPSHPEIRAAVAVNGVDKAMDAIMSGASKHVGVLAYGNYPFLSMYQNMIFGAELADSSAVEAINTADVPVLIIQSAKDEEIPADKYSIYAQRSKITAPKAQVCLYDKVGFDGHTSILYDDNGNPNMDIIQQVSAFYKHQIHHEE